MGFQLRRRLGAADLVTLCNAVLGFVAAVVAVDDPFLGARILLVAVMIDAVDGIVARTAGNTEVGPLLDSITDVVSFGATPGILLYGVVRAEYGEGGGVAGLDPALLAATLAAGATFVVLSVVRTAFYTVYVDGSRARPGVPNTLGATVLAAAHLTGLAGPLVLLAATPVLSVLMVSPVTYPSLIARDAIALGTVQALAILFPRAAGGALPLALLLAALAYLVLAPRCYWVQYDETASAGE